MSKPKAGAMETLEFALAVLKLIPPNRKTTAREITEAIRADGIDRDLRSVQRMLRQLSEHFEYIEVVGRGRPHSYRLRKNAPNFSLSAMNDAQALIFSLFRDLFPHYIPAQIEEGLKSYFEQADYILRSMETPEDSQRWRSKVLSKPPTQQLIPMKSDPAVFNTVSNALYRNTSLYLRYTNKEKIEREYITHPLGLVTRSPSLYLIADARRLTQPENVTEVRALAIHRIQEARPAREEVPQREFDLTEWAERSPLMFGLGTRLRLTFDIEVDSGYHLLETKLSEDQTVESVVRQSIDGDMVAYHRISATVYESLDLRQWLASFGKRVRLISLIPIEQAA